MLFEVHVVKVTENFIISIAAVVFIRFVCSDRGYTDVEASDCCLCQIGARRGLWRRWGDVECSGVAPL